MSSVGPPTAVTPDLLIGHNVAGKYALLSVLGEGGMGVVYLAEAAPSRRRVALKLLRAEYTKHEEVVARFEREAGAMAALAHENIVQALDFGRTERGEVYLAMELAEGESLRALLLRTGALPIPTTAEITRQVGAALARAHALGIVHRDLKPENVMVAFVPDGGIRVKVLDFGMARVASGQFGGSAPLTKQGAVFGTPEYMPPEQACGRAVDARADQYALGVMVYEMLAGRRPFRASSPLDMLQMQIHDSPPPLVAVAPWVPLPIAAVVERMLNKDPGRRFPDVSTATAQLTAAATAAPPDARPKSIHPTPTVRTTAQPIVPDALVPAPPRPRRTAAAIVLAAVVMAIAFGLEFWVRSHNPPPTAPPGSQAPAP